MKEFDKIIGYSSEKKELEQIADCLKNSDVYKKLGVNAPRGLLLHGEPGVGKTLMSACLIEASGRKAFICRKNKPDGAFVSEITRVFSEAKENAPSIVFLDDMDKFANSDSRHRDTDEYVTVQSCIDSIKGSDVFVLATANRTDCLPRSLLRAGRFDRRLRISAPKGADALEIISHYLEGKNLADDVDKKYIARLMDGHSCAKLETIINEAGLYAGFDRKDKISMSHFMRAYLRDMYGETRDEDDDEDDDDDYYSSTAPDAQLLRVACHEAGHAVISEILDPGSVTLVSVGGLRGGDRDGFTAYCNVNSLPPFENAVIRAITGLGGMAAVENKFGINHGGAAADLDSVFGIVSKMIENDGICGLHLHGYGFRNTSDLDSKIEQATIAEVEKYYLKAKQILACNSEFLDKLITALSEKKLLTTPEIGEIRNSCKIVPFAA